MKIIVPALLLKKFLRYVTKVAYEGFKDTKNSLFFKISKTDLTIEADNGKLAVLATFNTKDYDFEILETGVFLIDAYLLNELIKHFSYESLQLSLNSDNTLYIVTNNSKTNINLADQSHWNKIDFAIEGTSTTLETKNFADISHEVAFATAGSEGKPTFQGVAISNKDYHLVASATDTSRLVWKQLIPFDKPIDLILPTYALNEINRLNDFGCRIAQITYNQNQMLVNLDNKIKLLSTLIAGKFPDLTKQLERKFVTELVCVTATLISVIERCSVFHELTARPTVNFVVKKEVFQVISPKIEKGHHYQEVPTTKISGTDQDINFQSRFLLDTLRSFPSKSRTRIKFSEKEGPILLEIEDNDQIFNLILPFWVN